MAQKNSIPWFTLQNDQSSNWNAIFQLLIPYSSQVVQLEKTILSDAIKINRMASIKNQSKIEQQATSNESICKKLETEVKSFQEKVTNQEIERRINMESSYQEKTRLIEVFSFFFTFLYIQFF